MALAGIILAGVIAVSAMYFQYRRRRMWHETARIALEKGLPVPTEPSEYHTERSGAETSNGDVRMGLIMLAVGVGLYLFFSRLARDAAFVGAIPACIGVALLLYGLLSSRSRSSRSDVNPRS